MLRELDSIALIGKNVLLTELVGVVTNVVIVEGVDVTIVVGTDVDVGADGVRVLIVVTNVVDGRVVFLGVDEEIREERLLR